MSSRKTFSWASVSEPHTSVFNCDFSWYIIYIICRTSFRKSRWHSFNAIAAGRMRTIRKIFVHSVSQLAWAWITSCQEGQLDRMHLCTTVCVSAATFGLGSLSVSIGGLQGQGYCVERLSLEAQRGGRGFFSCWCVMALFLLFPKRPQVRTVYAWLFRLSLCIQQPE